MLMGITNSFMNSYIPLLREATRKRPLFFYRPTVPPPPDLTMALCRRAGTFGATATASQGCRVVTSFHGSSSVYEQHTPFFDRPTQFRRL